MLLLQAFLLCRVIQNKLLWSVTLEREALLNFIFNFVKWRVWGHVSNGVPHLMQCAIDQAIKRHSSFLLQKVQECFIFESLLGFMLGNLLEEGWKGKGSLIHKICKVSLKYIGQYGYPAHWAFSSCKPLYVYLGVMPLNSMELTSE